MCFSAAGDKSGKRERKGVSEGELVREGERKRKEREREKGEGLLG